MRNLSPQTITEYSSHVEQMKKNPLVGQMHEGKHAVNNQPFNNMYPPTSAVNDFYSSVLGSKPDAEHYTDLHAPAMRAS